MTSRNQLFYHRTLLIHTVCQLTFLGFIFSYSHAAAAAKSLQSSPTLCDPIDGSPPGSSIPGILQARTLEWVAISFCNAWKWKVKVKSESEVTQSCPTPSNPMDCSPPGSSVHGICQARVLEWGAIAFYKVTVQIQALRTGFTFTEGISYFHLWLSLILKEPSPRSFATGYSLWFIN